MLQGRKVAIEYPYQGRRKRPRAGTIYARRAALGASVRLGSAVLLAVVLIEGVFTIDLAQAAANGHSVTALTSFDLMSVFAHIYPIVPAPVIYLALGTILLGSRVLPRLYGYLALALGSAQAIVGLVGLLTTPILTLVVLGLQSLWVVAAAIALLVQPRKKADPAAVPP